MSNSVTVEFIMNTEISWKQEIKKWLAKLNLIDVARTFYNRSPRELQNFVSPLVAALPVRYRFGKNYWNTYNKIVKSERDPDFAKSYQIEMLKKQILHAYDKSAYWHEKLKDVAWAIKIYKNGFPWEEFQQLPLLKKDDIREHGLDMLTVPIEAADIVSTSGSSGRPLQFYMDKDRSVREFAFIQHTWSKAKFSPNDVRLVLRGTHINNVDEKPWEWNSALRELRVSPFHLFPKKMELYLSLIDKYKAQYIHGYPSAVSILAQHVLRKNWKPKEPIKGVFMVSERLHDDQYLVIKKAFPDAVMIPFYGMSEKVAFAGGVPELMGYYDFKPLYGYTELVDENGAPVTEVGQRGKIVSTGFITSTMPFFRYDTEDEAELVALPSADNAYKLRVKNIHSRWAQEFVVSREGALISMAALNLHSKEYNQIREFQFYQDEIGKVILKIIPLPGTDKAELQKLLKELSSKVGSGIDFKLKIVDRLKQNSRGKRPFIDQKLDISRYQNKVKNKVWRKMPGENNEFE